MTVMADMVTESKPTEKKGESSSPYFHIVVADVDVKVKIVAIGQPSESVNIFCTQRGGNRQSWESHAEEQVQNMLECIRQAFGSDEFKAIPLMAHNCAGLKIHRICESFAWTGKRIASRPSNETMEIYALIRQILEGLSDNPDALYNVSPGTTRHSFHNRVADQALRNEIARILGSSGQTEFKINSLMRLIDRSTTH